jgi:hypothetical protein
VEFGWHHVWDAKGYWQTTTKVGVESSKDNGSGYYDYNRYYLGQRLRYRAKTWEVSAMIRAAYYHFPVQMVSPTDSALREKTQIVAGCIWKNRLASSSKFSATTITTLRFPIPSTTITVPTPRAPGWIFIFRQAD